MLTIVCAVNLMSVGAMFYRGIRLAVKYKYTIQLLYRDRCVRNEFNIWGVLILT